MTLQHDKDFDINKLSIFGEFGCSTGECRRQGKPPPSLQGSRCQILIYGRYIFREILSPRFNTLPRLHTVERQTNISLLNKMFERLEFILGQFKIAVGAIAIN